jgi:hypothetical protein
MLVKAHEWWANSTNAGFDYDWTTEDQILAQFD